MTERAWLVRLLRHQQRLRGGVIATVGFVLSPLSWWNDLLVNVPLAIAFATVVALFGTDLFVPALIVGYWLTNVLGFILLHVGAESVISDTSPAYTRRRLARDFLLSVGYTGLIVLLVQVGVITYPAGLFT